MKFFGFLFLCLLFASGFSHGEQFLQIRTLESLTEEQKKTAITAGYAALQYMKRQREISHSFGERFERLKVRHNAYGGTSEDAVIRMNNLYGVPEYVEKEDITKGRGNINGASFPFVDVKTFTDIKEFEDEGTTFELVIKDMNTQDGQLDILPEEMYKLHEAMGFSVYPSFERAVKIRYSSPLSNNSDFNIFNPSYGELNKKTIEMIKSGVYEGIEQVAGGVSFSLSGDIETMYVSVSEPLGGGGGAPPRGQLAVPVFASQGLLSEIDFSETVYVSVSEPLGGGGGAPPRGSQFVISNFAPQEEAVWGVSYGDSFKAKISTGYSFDELEDGILEFDDGALLYC